MNIVAKSIKNAQPFLKPPRATEAERHAELAAAAALVRESVAASVLGGRSDLAEKLREIACTLESAAR